MVARSTLFPMCFKHLWHPFLEDTGASLLPSCRHADRFMNARNKQTSHGCRLLSTSQDFLVNFAADSAKLWNHIKQETNSQSSEPLKCEWREAPGELFDELLERAARVRSRNEAEPEVAARSQPTSMRFVEIEIEGEPDS